MSLTKKGNIMTEQEFKQALDKVVLEGINKLGAGTVLGSLAVVTRFTEVVYDMQTVERLHQNAVEAKAAAKETTGE
jgi:hypothetical protein